MDRSIYLAGLISTEHPETLAWREQARRLIHKYGDWDKYTVHVVSPLRGLPDLAEHTNDGGMNDDRLWSEDVLLRTYQDVCRADVVLADLTPVEGRALLGTLMELAWAWERRIPIIAVCPRPLLFHCPESTIREHPMLRGTVTRWFEALDPACRHIVDYYLA